MIKPVVVGRASSPPRGVNQSYWQQRIDGIVGTRDGRPNVKLAWAPAELRWCPRRMEDEPRGYIFPIFCNGANEQGVLVAPDLWVLLERIEYPQFAPTWELGRYSRFDGSMWDWKGPIPKERYIELYVHSYHDGSCCPCHGPACKCKQAHCWGRYSEPNDNLIEWVSKRMDESRNDPDVDPMKDIRDFTAPQAQRDLITAQQRAKEKEDAEMAVFDKEMRDVFDKQIHSMLVTENVNRTESGIILLS